jgi:hypothetical protein
MTGDLIVKFTVKLGFVTGYMHTDNAVWNLVCFGLICSFSVYCVSVQLEKAQSEAISCEASTSVLQGKLSNLFKIFSLNQSEVGWRPH